MLASYAVNTLYSWKSREPEFCLGMAAQSLGHNCSERHPSNILADILCDAMYIKRHVDRSLTDQEIKIMSGRSYLRQLRSIILRTNILLRTFSKCSIEVKLHLFQSYCTNLYCSHLWYIYTKTQLNKLRITYNNSLRRLFNLHPRCSASAMFAYSHMPSLDEIRRKYIMYRFIQRLNSTYNSILLCFMSSTNMLTSSIWRQWYRCVYMFN